MLSSKSIVKSADPFTFKIYDYDSSNNSLILHYNSFLLKYMYRKDKLFRSIMYTLLKDISKLSITSKSKMNFSFDA